MEIGKTFGYLLLIGTIALGSYKAGKRSASSLEQKTEYFVKLQDSVYVSEDLKKGSSSEFGAFIEVDNGKAKLKNYAVRELEEKLDKNK